MEELKELRFDKDDKLQRKIYAERLTNFLIANKDEINVACINAPWGTGKTWFVHMWKNYILDEFSKKEDGTGIIPVYYNSWENDDADSAFVPLIAEIKSQLFPDEKDLSKEVFKKLAQAGGAIIKEGIFNTVSVATGGIFDLKAGVEAIKDEDVFDESIVHYKDIQTAKKNFKSNLELIVKETRKQVFVFIDELDRCRPTFAIETLERIKHYFDVDGITFILMLDKEQLSYSVKVLYGSDCDTAGYLLRFFDIEYSLPKISKSYQLDAIFDSRAIFAYLVKEIDKYFNLSLRDYQKISLWLRAFSIGIDKSWSPFAREDLQLIMYFMILKLKHPEEFSKYCNITSIYYDKLPRASETDKICLSKYKVDVVNIFVRACNVIKGDLEYKHYLDELTRDNEESINHRANFFSKCCEKGRCQIIFDTLTFIEKSD